jgi:hypothetical protein
MPLPSLDLLRPPGKRPPRRLALRATLRRALTSLRICISRAVANSDAEFGSRVGPASHMVPGLAGERGLSLSLHSVGNRTRLVDPVSPLMVVLGRVRCRWLIRGNRESRERPFLCNDADRARAPNPKEKGGPCEDPPFFSIPACAGVLYLCTSAMAAIVPGPWQVMQSSFLALAARRVS